MPTQLTLIENTHSYTPPLVTARANLAKAQAAFQKAEKLLEEQGPEAMVKFYEAEGTLELAEKQVERWERSQLLIEATKPQTKRNP